MAASIETLYTILGYPDIAMRQDALNLDKFLQSIYSFKRDQLGVLLTTRSMTVGLAESKWLLMIEELGH